MNIPRRRISQSKIRNGDITAVAHIYKPTARTRRNSAFALARRDELSVTFHKILKPYPFATDNFFAKSFATAKDFTTAPKNDIFAVKTTATVKTAHIDKRRIAISFHAFKT